MERKVLLVFCLIMIHGFMLPVFGALTEDKQKENGIWDRVWKNIRSDDKKMQETILELKNDRLSKIPEKESQWVKLLQERLMKNALPNHVTTTATPGVKSNIDDDIKMFLVYLQKSGVRLSNDQWKSLLDFVLSTKKAKSLTPTTTASTFTQSTASGPSSSSTSVVSAATNLKKETDSEGWTQELSKALDINAKSRNVKVTGATKSPFDTVTKDGTMASESHWKDGKYVVSEEEWERFMKRVMTDSAVIPNYSPSTTKEPSLSAISSSNPTSTPRHARFGNNMEHSTSESDPTSTETQKHLTTERPNGIYESDQEWERILQEAMDWNGKQGGDPIDGETTQSTIVKSPAPADDWERVLEEAMGVNHGLKHNETQPTPATQGTQTDSTVSGHTVSDTEWERTLQEAMTDNGRFNHADRVGKSGTTGQHNDSEYNNKIGERQWIKLLERQLNINTNGVDDDDNNDDIGNRQWRELLERTLGMTKDLTKQTTAAPSVQATRESIGKDSTIIGKDEWDHILQEAMDQNAQKQSQSAPRAEKPTADIASADDYDADDQWEKILNIELNAGKQEIAKSTKSLTSEPMLDDSTENPTLSAVGEESTSKSFATQAFYGEEKVENDISEDKNLYLLLAFGIGSGVLLMILIVAVVMAVCRKKGLMCWNVKNQHKTVLNVDGNRWDPQMLRPSKENMNAFLYSIPMPLNEVKINI